MSDGSIEKHEYLRRLDAMCDLFLGAMATGATTPEELFAHLPALLEQMPEYHRALVPKAYPEIIAAILKPKNKNAIWTHVVAEKAYLRELGARLDQGQPAVYFFPAMTCEIFYGMDLVPMSLEMIPLLLAAGFMEGVEAELDASEAEGFPGHVCAMQRSPIVAIEKGYLPHPAVFVKPGAPCDSSNMSYQYAVQRFGTPLLLLDSPYNSGKRAFGYYLDNFKRMIEDLERLTGHRLDEERLRRHVALGNRQLGYLYGLQRLRRQAPNPDPGMHRALDCASLMLCGSNEEHAEYLRTCYEEAKARAESGRSFLPEGKKEIRTVWTWGVTAHILYLFDWLEDEFGVTFLECGITNLPEEIVGYVDTTSVESMIEGLAWRSFNYPMHRTVMGHSDVYVNDMLEIARTYRADAAVFSGNQSCKHAWASAKIISDVLQEELEIPSLTWETDLVDKRFTPHSSAKAQLSEFFRTFL